jgi:hypothetical protein
MWFPHACSTGISSLERFEESEAFSEPKKGNLLLLWHPSEVFVDQWSPQCAATSPRLYTDSDIRPWQTPCTSLPGLPGRALRYSPKGIFHLDWGIFSKHHLIPSQPSILQPPSLNLSPPHLYLSEEPSNTCLSPPTSQATPKHPFSMDWGTCSFLWPVPCLSTTYRSLPPIHILLGPTKPPTSSDTL